jgi:hypothetical protein
MRSLDVEIENEIALALRAGISAPLLPNTRDDLFRKPITMPNSSSGSHQLA